MAISKPMKREPSPIRYDEWLAELERIEAESKQQSRDGFTITEVVLRRGDDPDDMNARRKVRALIRKGLSAGTIERLSVKRAVLGMDGRQAWVAAFKVTRQKSR